MAPASSLSLRALPQRLAVCRLPADADVPPWAVAARFFSVTRTTDEMSVVCPESSVPGGVESETGWRALQVDGPLDFSLTGVLASLAGPLAEAGIPIFVLSTFETDVLLVKTERLAAAVEVLRRAGHRVDKGSANQPPSSWEENRTRPVYNGRSSTRGPHGPPQETDAQSQETDQDTDQETRSQAKTTTRTTTSRVSSKEVAKS